MGDRGNVLDKSYLEILALERTDSSLTACTRSLYEYLNDLEAMLLSGSCSCLGSGLSGEGSALLGAAEA